MGLPWIKLYLEARTDPKLQAGLTGDQFRIWFNLLLFSAQQPRRGIIHFDNPKILAAEVASGDLELLEKTLKELVALSIVKCVTERDISVTSCDTAVTFCDASVTFCDIVFLNFDKRQLKPDVLRQRKCRERKKLKGTNCIASEHGSDCQKERDISVTGCDKSVTKSVDLELRIKRGEFAPAPPCARVDAPAREGSPPQDASLRNGDAETASRTPPPNGELRRESEILPSTPRRDPADQLEFDQACKLLGSDLRTEGLALEMGRRETLPEVLSTPGWRFRRAAAILLSPEKSDGQRRSWPFFWGIVRGLRDEERYAAPRSSRKDRDPPLDSETYTYHCCTPEQKAAYAEQIERIRNANMNRDQRRR